jgi:uncharacterized protein (TIGR02118 family)
MIYLKHGQIIRRNKKLIKIISPFRMNLTKMSRKECDDHWLHKHGPLVRRDLPGLRRYLQNHLTPLPGDNDPQPEWDGVAELYFDDLESWQKARQFLAEDPGGQAIRDDIDRFIVDRDKLWFLVTEEKVIMDMSNP